MTDGFNSQIDKQNTPKWAHECYSNPKEGIIHFLEELCNLSGASFAHIRILSRLGYCYTMVESIGPYKKIGPPRYFCLLNNNNDENKQVMNPAA